MENKISKNLVILLVPIVILIAASITLVSTGVITFEKPDNTSGEITVTLTIDNGENKVSYKVETDNATAFEVLEKAQEETDLTFQAEYFEEHQSHLINSINGVGSTNSKYWIFYLNGEFSPVGADQKYVEDGDIIIFKLEQSPW